MKNKDELKDELSELSPFLASRRERDDGFRVPKDFFKTFPDKVMEQVGQEPKPAPARHGWLDDLAVFIQNLTQPRLALALAAALVLVVAGVWCFKKEKTAAEQALPVAEVKLEDISDEELQAYLSSNIEHLEQEDLVAGVEAEEAEPQEQKTLAPTPKPEAEELEEYLDEHIEDLELEDLEEVL